MLSLLLVSTITGTHAADPIPVAPEINLSTDTFNARWSGFYLGASVGGGWGKSNAFYDRAGDDHLTRETSNPSGFLGSFTMGYNYQFANRFVLGIEGDLGFMNLSASDKIDIWDGHIWKSQFGGVWGTVRPRVGYAFEKMMVYATGGVAIMGTDEIILGDNDATQNTYNAGVHTGWVLGAGVEYALTERLSTKIEYLHMEFPEYRSYTNNNELYGFENSVGLVRVGLNYKF
ncbi:MAG: porin family protein [Rhizobiaceae bacterium]|nr:porin family protein [Rhizobiaceae bacterium]